MGPMGLKGTGCPLGQGPRGARDRRQGRISPALRVPREHASIRNKRRKRGSGKGFTECASRGKTVIAPKSLYLMHLSENHTKNAAAIQKLRITATSCKSPNRYRPNGNNHRVSINRRNLLLGANHSPRTTRNADGIQHLKPALCQGIWLR